MNNIGRAYVYGMLLVLFLGFYLDDIHMVERAFFGGSAFIFGYYFDDITDKGIFLFKKGVANG